MTGQVAGSPSVGSGRGAVQAGWEAVDHYLIGSLVDEDEALIAARESAGRTTTPGAAIPANQGALLALLVQMSRAGRVLEFGTLAGYSTIWLARAVGPEGTVVTLELEPSNV